MPDTKILPSHWVEEGADVSENELREWMSDISKDLKESIAASARHSQESAVYRASNDARVKNIEDHMEKRSAFKSGAIMAGVGTFFGAAAAAIGRKTGLWTAMLAAVLLCGCALTEQEKRDVGIEVALATHPDGTPLTPEERAALIAKYGGEKKESKGLDFLSGLIPLALSLVATLGKKAVL